MLGGSTRQVGVALLAALIWPVLLCGAETAATTSVRTVPDAGLPAGSAVQVAVVGETGEVRRVDAGVVELGPDDRVTCVGDGVWCPRLKPLESRPEILLPAFRRASFDVTLELPVGETWDDERLQAEIWLPRAHRPDAPFRFVEEVTVEDSSSGLTAAWVGPAVVLDLRIAAEGWAPRYRFDVDAGAGDLSLGVLPMRRGASLTAFAVDMETGAPVASVKAFVRQPDVELQEPRAERLRVQGTTNERGFVQLHNVPPGTYDLVLESPDRPTAYVRGVDMVEAQETWLGEVELAAFARLAVHLDPPTDDGVPWRVELAQTHDPWKETTAVADESGMAVWPAIAQGLYSMNVVGANGDRVLSEERWIGGNEAVFLPLDLVRVSGHVLMGREGVRANVELTTGAMDRTSFETDEEGHFAGRLSKPAEGKVAALIETDTGVSRLFQVEPVLRRGVHEMTFKLGTHEIRGRVLESDSRLPIDGASVDLSLPAHPEFLAAPATTDADGRFAFKGLEDGSYSAYAYMHGYTQSRPVQVNATEISDRDGKDVTIVLQPGSPVDVLVTSASGEPQRNAHLSIITLTPEGIGVGEATTDLGGRGRVVVPRSVAPASVVVRAPIGVLWSGCVSLPAEGTELHLRISTGSGGALSLRPSGMESQAGASDQALVSLDGGLLTVQDLLNWTADLGLAHQELPVPDGGTLTVPRVASGHYAVTETASLGLAAYPAACQGALQPLGSWEFLPAGGELELPFRFADHGSGLWLPF